MTGLPIWLSGILLIVVPPAVVVGLQIGMRRRWPVLRDGEQNEVAGFIIAVVGVIYAVLLAFVVIVSWENFSHAEQVVGDEASALRTIYRDSGAFPPQVREELHDTVRRYAAAVVETEWPAMARGEPGSPEVTHIIDETSQTLANLPVGTPSQQQYQGIEADRFNDLVTARSQRVDFVEQGVPSVLWIALVVGAVVTIGFTMIFALSSTVLHTLMTASLTALIGVLMFVAVAIDHPFSGDVAVDPAPLERVLSDFGQPR
ncbi:DUF4239 domain-containing protein [Actinomycetospora endophytica]|uniref:DUF4239 domain-containing protein n=1 Tax=Actinomycetospora endophytica TaxID=2291215 RepID=A0ABS8P3M2_9PSEU|nr:DUF4239 domain-containing protein [Actinomycetospora endophytica]MCD2192857.1 DUF4239 domain-containing protein [Actinomycetospora endophytica]